MKEDKKHHSADPWFAVNLSFFFAGLGQLYIKAYWHGTLIIITQFVFLINAFWHIFSPRGYTLLGLGSALAFFLIHAMNLFDVYENYKQVQQKKSDLNDTERICISAKIPFSDISDPFERARMNYSHSFYSLRAAWQLQQSLGRTRRGNDDDYDNPETGEIRGFVAIADGNWTRIKRFMSQAILDSIVSC